jgi:UDP-glucose 4-epimerase
MKILITGANGYVGRSLYNAFKSKYEVSFITRDKIDLTDSKNVNSFFLDNYFDVVLHCAIEGGHRLEQDDWKVMDDNLIMYYNLLQNKKSFGKFINFGSGAELYMKNKPYGFSKKVIRKSVLNNSNFYNLRMFGVFDENELNTRFIKANIKRYINKESILIHQNKYMDFIYIPDLIKIVDYYINNDGPKEINCNYSSVCTLEKIANIINNLNEYKVDIEIKNKELEKSYIGNFEDLEINFIGLRKGIEEVYNKLK